LEFESIKMEITHEVEVFACGIDHLKLMGEGKWVFDVSEGLFF
jgi:hypothetical protein